MSVVADKPAAAETHRVVSGDAPSAARAAVIQTCTSGLRERLAVLRRARRAVAGDCDAVVEACRLPWRRSDAETIQAEVLPLLSAMKWLERNAGRTLRDRRVGRRGRPAWLWGVTSVARREPVGRVMIIAPANYPLLLPGVQLVQAYAAGNRVAVKPAPGCRPVMDRFVAALREAGMTDDAVEVLDEDPAEATRRIDAGAVDKVFLTGSDRTGRAVMRQLAERGIPSVMELSGCDAMCVLPGADLDRVVRAIRFGLRLNASQTCIAPRRVLVDRSLYEPLCRRVDEIVTGLAPAAVSEAMRGRVRELADEAVRGGARVVAGGESDADEAGLLPRVLRDVSPDHGVAGEDTFAPVVALIPCDGPAGIRRAYERCGYRLGASVFGGDDAVAFADRLDAGHVVVNDLIAPTADPRLPFPARGRSGFGATRGPEGLLEMTQVKAVIRRRGRMTPHLDDPHPDDEPLARALLAAGHAPRLRDRLAAMKTLVSLGRARYRSPGDAPPADPSTPTQGPRS